MIDQAAAPSATPSDSSSVARRSVVAGLGVIGSLAAVFTARKTTPSAAPVAAAEPAQASRPTDLPSAVCDDEAHGRYQASEHVRRYYRTAQI